MSKSDKLAELEHRVAELEQARHQEQRVIAALADHGFSRRQMIGLLGAGAVTFVGTASAAPQTQTEPWHGDFAILLGPDANNDPEEDPTGKRRLMYFGEDTSTIYTTVWDDDTWTQFGTVGGGGGGGDVEYQEDGSSLTTAVAVINAATGITATEPTADEIDIDLDESVLKDGGAKELDVVELAGGLGTSGQIPETDGAAVSWTDRVLSDSGSDNADGGDIYQFPQVEDSIDGQGGAGLTSFDLLDALEVQIGGSTLHISGEFIEVQNWDPSETSDQSTTSTTYTSVTNITGQLELENIPAAATGYIRFLARLKNNTSGETTFARPSARDGDSLGVQSDITEAEVSRSSTSFGVVDSGWVELTSIADDNTYLFQLQLKVSGGTGTIRPDESGILVGWRL